VNEPVRGGDGAALPDSPEVAPVETQEFQDYAAFINDVINTIERHHVAVVGFPHDDRLVLYTVGHTFRRYPELVVTGLDLDQGGMIQGLHLLNELSELQAGRGRPFEVGEELSAPDVALKLRFEPWSLDAEPPLSLIKFFFDDDVSLAPRALLVEPVEVSS